MSAVGVMLVASDVEVIPIPSRLCTECGTCDVTHFVQLDARATGQILGLLEACHECAAEFADRLRESLPQNEDAP